MKDPFVGTWKLNPAKSDFHPNHRPTEATMRWERDSEGRYEMTTEGRSAAGEPVVEKPQTFTPDGVAWPIPDFPGLSATTTRLAPGMLQSEAMKEDGSVLGRGTYAVSGDGRSMTATTEGFDFQLRPFQARTVWDRVS